MSGTDAHAPINEISQRHGGIGERLMNEDGLCLMGSHCPPRHIETILNAMQLGLQAAKLQNKENAPRRNIKNHRNDFAVQLKSVSDMPHYEVVNGARKYCR